MPQNQGLLQFEAIKRESADTDACLSTSTTLCIAVIAATTPAVI
jgi:hypothetical protein